MNATVLFIDDDDIERRSGAAVLSEIFAGTSVSIANMAPLPTLANYAELVVAGPVAFILDHRLNTSGRVLYSGIDLAAHLRAIGSRVPMVILTNYDDDDFSSNGWAVECIVKKRSTLWDPTSPAAREFKLRLLRQIEICGNILAARESRFHELLIKSSHEMLTADDEKELRQLEGERVVSVSAAERDKQLGLDAEIANLKKLLGRELL